MLLFIILFPFYPVLFLVVDASWREFWDVSVDLSAAIGLIAVAILWNEARRDRKAREAKMRERVLSRHIGGFGRGA